MNVPSREPEKKLGKNAPSNKIGLIDATENTVVSQVLFEAWLDGQLENLIALYHCWETCDANRNYFGRNGK